MAQRPTAEHEAPRMARRQTLIGDHPISDAEAMLEVYEPGDMIGQGSFGIIVCPPSRPLQPLKLTLRWVHLLATSGAKA